MSRVIGRVSSDVPGPTLVCIGGLHGNEPAGIAALQSVVAKLQETQLLARGDFVALAGNLRALANSKRFIARDLNRHWRPHALRGALTSRDHDSSEDKEQYELARELTDTFGRARGEIYLLDVHTTSGEGKPFIVIADSLKSRKFALQFPNPLVLGLAEHLDGTLIDCVTNLGHAAVAFEGGQSENPASTDNLEAAIWVALDSATLLDTRNGRASQARNTLSAAAAGLPKVVEILHRHVTAAGDGFRMSNSHQGFDRVTSGQLLATDASGDITAPVGGYLLMPLYQKQGNDGFFVARELPPLPPPSSLLPGGEGGRRREEYISVSIHRDLPCPLHMSISSRSTTWRWCASTGLRLMPLISPSPASSTLRYPTSSRAMRNRWC